MSARASTKTIPASAGAERADRGDLLLLAALWLWAAVVVAVWRAAEPFEHGIWLVAYLVLVGFVAQLLIARGQAELRWLAGLPAVGQATCRSQLALWNFAVVVVSAGVCLETRLAVVLGTLALLAAVLSFFASVRDALDRSQVGSLGRSYLALLAFMAASAVTGLALAWDLPWLAIT